MTMASTFCVCVCVCCVLCVCVCVCSCELQLFSKVTSPLPIAISAEMQATSYNVRESDKTFALVITTNETSEFAYNVSLIAMDISTGEHG